MIARARLRGCGGLRVAHCAPPAKRRTDTDHALADPHAEPIDPCVWVCSGQSDGASDLPALGSFGRTGLSKGMYRESSRPGRARACARRAGTHGQQTLGFVPPRHHGGSPLGSFRQDAGPAVGRFPLASFCRPGVRAIPGGFVLPECRPAAGFVLPIHRAIPGGFVLPECRPAIGFVPPRRRTVPVGFVPPRRRSIPVGFVPPKQQQVRWVRFGQNSSRFVGFVSPKQQQVRWVRFAKALVTPIGFVLPKCQAIPVGRRFRAANCRVKCHFAHGSRFSRASARSAGTRSAHRLRARKHGHVAHCTIFKDAPFIQNPVILSSVLY